MEPQEKWICPACNKPIKVGARFCTNCGAKLSDLEEIETSLMKGWEISIDRIDKYKNMVSSNPLGNPIIVSKCKLDRENGLLIVSDNGFAWRITMGFRTGITKAFTTGFTTGLGYTEKSKWVRWHDVSNIIPIKEGVMLVELKIRKYGSLILYGPRIKRWKFTIQQNMGELRPNFMKRQQNFYNIMSEIYNRNKGDTDPPISDSRM